MTVYFDVPSDRGGFWRPAEGEVINVVFKKFDTITGKFGEQQIIRGYDMEGKEIVVVINGSLKNIVTEPLEPGDIIAIKYLGRAGTTRKYHNYVYKIYSKKLPEVRKVLEQLKLIQLL